MLRLCIVGSLDIVLSATVQPSLKKMMQTLSSLRCGRIAAGEQNAKRWLLLLFWQTKNFREETWLLKATLWLSSLRIYGTIWQPQFPLQSFRSTALLGAFFRSVTITERAYAGPDYTSGQTLSTTVGIEHEKDSRLLEIGDWNVDTMLTFAIIISPVFYYGLFVLLWFIKRFIDVLFSKKITVRSPETSHLFVTCGTRPVPRFQPRLVPHPSSVLWLLLDLMKNSCQFHTPKHGKHGNFSLVLSFDGSFLKSCDKLRMEMESVILLPNRSAP